MSDYTFESELTSASYISRDLQRICEKFLRPEKLAMFKISQKKLMSQEVMEPCLKERERVEGTLLDLLPNFLIDR